MSIVLLYSPYFWCVLDFNILIFQWVSFCLTQRHKSQINPQTHVHTHTRTLAYWCILTGSPIVSLLTPGRRTTPEASSSSSQMAWLWHRCQRRFSAMRSCRTLCPTQNTSQVETIFHSSLCYLPAVQQHFIIGLLQILRAQSQIWKLATQFKGGSYTGCDIYVWVGWERKQSHTLYGKVNPYNFSCANLVVLVMVF